MREKHYVERNGKLYARAYYKDSKTGKWKQVWRKVDSITQAREVANEVTQQLKAGTEAFDTLNAYLDVWLGAHRVSPRTFGGLYESSPASYPATPWKKETNVDKTSRYPADHKLHAA